MRLTGPREDVPAERLARMRAVAHNAWRESLDQRARTRRRTWVFGGVGLAVAASVWFALAINPRPPAPATPLASSVPAPSIVAHVLAAMTPGAFRTGEAIQAGASIETPAGAWLTLRLASGSEVRVDAGSLLRVLDSHHLAVDRGAIYYDGHDAALVIDTPAGVIHDVGTRFEVRLLGRGVRIRVREGLVRLDRSGRLDDAGPGVEMLATPSRHDRARARDTPRISAWAWTERAAAPFSLDGQTLSTFLTWIAREGGWSVGFADQALERSAGETIVHGSVAGLTTEEALAVVLPACGLDHGISDGRVTIRRPARQMRLDDDVFHAGSVPAYVEWAQIQGCHRRRVGARAAGLAPASRRRADGRIAPDLCWPRAR